MGREQSAWDNTLKRLTTKPDTSMYNIVNLQQYCHLEAELDHEVRCIDGLDPDFNLFVKNCCSEVVHLVGAKQEVT